MAERLRPDERIRRRTEYEKIYRDGTRFHARLMTLFVLPNGRPGPRLGIAATRKLGSAVRRNRAKRLVREVFRRNKPAAGYDIVVVPRPEMLSAGFADLEADYCSALRRRVRR
jgi:ribonuclease P protein component